MSAKQVIIQNDYSPKEMVTHFVPLRDVAKFLTNNLNNSPMGLVSTAISVVAYQWNLRPNRANEFKVIKKILINSVLNN